MLISNNDLPETTPETTPEKKSVLIKILVLIELISLAALIAFILSYKNNKDVVYIDKSKPSPLVDVGVKEKSAIAPQKEEEKTDLVDHKAKYEKRGIKEEVIEIEKEPEVEPAEVKVEVAKKSEAKVAPIKEEVKEKPIEKEAIKEVKEEVKEETKVAKKMPDDKYFLQVGAFARQEYYEDLKSSMEKDGYPMDIKTTKKKVSLYTVTVGRYDTSEQAQEALEELKRLKYEGSSAELDNGKFEISLKPIYNGSKAIEIKDDLAKNKLRSKVKVDEQITDLHLLRVGPYPSKEKALEIQAELKKKGRESYLFNK